MRALKGALASSFPFLTSAGSQTTAGGTLKGRLRGGSRNEVH